MAAMKTQRLTRLGLLVAVGLMLNLLERQFPPPVPVPGVRLGLANTATLVALVLEGPGAAFLVWSLRFVLASMLGGSLFAPGFFVGAAGGLAAWAAMAALSRQRTLGLVGISLAGAIAHHVGQVAAAAQVTSTPAVIYLLPPLLALAVPVGLLPGVLVLKLLHRLWSAGSCGTKADGLWVTWPGGPRLVRRADWALAGLTLVAALLLLFGRSLLPLGGGALAEVTVAGQSQAKLDLRQDGLYPVTAGDGHLEIEVKEGAVRVRESDCPDQLCVLSGWIRHPGEVVVCAPFRVAVRILGGAETGPDAILR